MHVQLIDIAREFHRLNAKTIKLDKFGKQIDKPKNK